MVALLAAGRKHWVLRHANSSKLLPAYAKGHYFYDSDRLHSLLCVAVPEPEFGERLSRVAGIVGIQLAYLQQGEAGGMIN